MALVHIDGDAAARTAEGVKDAVGLVAALEVYRDHVALPPNAGSGELGHPSGGGVEGPLSVGRGNAVGGMQAQPVAGSDGKILVVLGDFEEALLHRFEFFRVLGGEIGRLRKVVLEIEEFPLVGG